MLIDHEKVSMFQFNQNEELIETFSHVSKLKNLVDIHLITQLDLICLLDYK